MNYPVTFKIIVWLITTMAFILSGASIFTHDLFGMKLYPFDTLTATVLFLFFGFAGIYTLNEFRWVEFGNTKKRVGK